MSKHILEGLLHPRSVAVIGASTRSEAMGSIVIRNLQAFGFTGAIYPVHPSTSEINGLPCFNSVQQLPEPPDCAVVALPADKVVSAVRAIGAAGGRNVVVFASGFAETGSTGAALQRELQEVCLRYGMNLCGPNCLGLVSLPNRSPLYSALVPADLPQGGLALLSHSGSVCILLTNMGRFGFSHVVSLGNDAVTDMSAYLDYLVDDASTRVAALFLETIRDPAAFMRAALRMRAAGKPVVVLKVGRSRSGAATSAAHTGALATPDDAFRDFCRRCGVTLVEDFDELADTCALFLGLVQRPASLKLGVLGVSGGELSLLCDMAEQCGLSLADLAPTTLEQLRETLPPFASPRNPVDVTGAGVFDTGLYRRCVRSLREDPAVDLLLVAQDCPAGLDEDQAVIYHALTTVLAQEASEPGVPIIFLNTIAVEPHADVRAPLDAVQIPSLQGLRTGLLALRHLEAYGQWQRQTVPPRVYSADPSPVWRRRLSQETGFSERDSQQFLAEHGIVSGVPIHTATDADQAVKAARVLGYPVVMKIDASGIAHKSDLGGVALGLRDDAAVRAAFDRIKANVQQAGPGIALEGVTVQPMISGGLELIVGVVNRAPFGPAVVVGLGGVWVELMSEAELALAPFDAARAQTLLKNARFYRLLQGYRGSPALDEPALIRLLVDVSEVAWRYRHCVEALDLNPVVVLPQGQGIRILDALLVPVSAHNQKEV